MTHDDDTRRRLARLEAQVESLEAALERRSRQLCDIVTVVCREDRELVAAIVSGRPVDAVRLDRLRRYYAMGWHTETTTFVRRDVGTALEELWAEVPGRPESLGDRA